MCSKVILWSLVLFRAIYSAGAQTVNQPDSVITALLGKSVTLECFFSHNVRYMFWYKQKPGKVPKIMVMAHVLADCEFKNGFSELDYSIQKEDGVFHLTIRNVTASDEALYYCATSELYNTVFGNGTFLALRDYRNHRLDLTTLIQTSVPDLGHTSNSETLECTVLAETRTKEVSVFWFRPTSGDHHPVSIYIQKNCSSEMESGSPTQNCVFRLPGEHISDSGTFYCAVASYGELLFGKGANLDTKPIQSVDPIIVGLGAALALCIAVIIFLAFLTYKKTNCTDCKACTTPHHTPLRAQVGDQGCEAEMPNYAALQFTKGKSNSGRMKRGPPQESMYSDVRTARS